MATSVDEEFDEKFVKTWTEAAKLGAGTAWISQQLGVERRYILNKAETLRKHGVKLPRLISGHYAIRKRHVTNLNKIIEDEDA